MGQGQEIPRFLVQCVDWDGEWALGQEEEPSFVPSEFELSGNWPRRVGSKVWLSGVNKM